MIVSRARLQVGCHTMPSTGRPSTARSSPWRMTASKSSC